MNPIKRIRRQLRLARAVADMAQTLGVHYGHSYQRWFDCLSRDTKFAFQEFSDLGWLHNAIVAHYELRTVRQAMRKGGAA